MGTSTAPRGLFKTLRLHNGARNVARILPRSSLSKEIFRKDSIREDSMWGGGVFSFRVAKKAEERFSGIRSRDP